MQRTLIATQFHKTRDTTHNKQRKSSIRCLQMKSRKIKKQDEQQEQEAKIEQKKAPKKMGLFRYCCSSNWRVDHLHLHRTLDVAHVQNYNRTIWGTAGLFN